MCTAKGKGHICGMAPKAGSKRGSLFLTAFKERAAMSFLIPKHVFKNVTHIGLPFLQKQGIKALVLDVDNTLTAHGSQELRQDIKKWLKSMRDGGIHLMLASNNTKKRVAPFAKKLGLSYVSFCCKPAPLWLFYAMRKWQLPKSQVALVGDQLFTDYLAGSLYGARVFVVRPIYKDTKPTICFKRKLEKPLLLKYYKNGGELL